MKTFFNNSVNLYRLINRLILFMVLGLNLAGDANGQVYKSQIKPQWSADNSHFWYRNDLAKGQQEFILVDLKKGTRRLAFNHSQLSTLLEEAGVNGVKAERLSLEQLSFDLSNHLTTFHIKGTYFQYHLKTQKLTKIDKPKDAPEQEKSESNHSQVPRVEPAKPYHASRDISADGKWRAYIHEHNVYVRAASGEEQPIQLSTDGKTDNRYQSVYWAANSNNLISFRVQPDKVGQVHLIESAPSEGGRAKLQTRQYALPGDKFTTHEMNWFDLKKQLQVKPAVGLIDFRNPRRRWTPSGGFARYQKIDRGHQRLRVIEVDVFSGTTRNIIDEVSDTFIWTEHVQNLGVPLVNWLKQTNEIIYLSEQDGWRHLYLIDVASGKTKNQITQGEYLVRAVDRIDEEKRQIWFRGSGKNAKQDPYFIQYYRVNFDGSGLTALTEGDGDHQIAYSPDHEFIIDSYSRVDMAPVHELRRVRNGHLVCQLEQADTQALEATGWKPPEVFSAKGRDGETDIWGVIYRPQDFDPNKVYPVLEHMYAGPHSSYVPKQFSPGNRYLSMTDLGFVVVKMDGMGTANRSKAFHDVCWQNLKDAGFPDRILWHQSVAEKYRWYDTSRVGIYGGSAGGQSSTGALLFHPEFYKVAVSSCGCHDNRMDKASWNEQWMGYPVGPHYAASSNIDNAHHLRGKLMLIVGELDKNVPPESTMRLAAALIRANKDFDLIVIPGGGHGDGGPYGDRRRKDFFRKHLLGLESPDINAVP
jgi:hypothetical protein